jgi:hypothetical protein
MEMHGTQSCTARVGKGAAPMSFCYCLFDGLLDPSYGVSNEVIQMRDTM